MTDVHQELRTAYETAGFDVGEVTENRGLVRVVLIEEAGAEEVRPVLDDVVGEDALGVNVTTESVDGQDGLSTVVSFRDRS